MWYPSELSYKEQNPISSRQKAQNAEHTCILQQHSEVLVCANLVFFPLFWWEGVTTLLCVLVGGEVNLMARCTNLHFAQY